MSRIVLTGCRSTPLGAYLKALGAFRLVAEQVDAEAMLAWAEGGAVLESVLDAEGLVAFFVERYTPTPVLSPWNSDAGFKESESSTATRRLGELERSTDDRLRTFRTALAAVRAVRADPRWATWSKKEQVVALRNTLPDEALAWVDAAVVLRDRDPSFPPLLGTGGNFGRQELSPAFIGLVLEVLGTAPKARERSRAWAAAALLEAGGPALTANAAGQFDPGAAGGVRATAVGQGNALTNPWDLVLQIEGALVWTSGVARRTTSGPTLASVPFTVAPTAAGHASLARGERARAELWAPLWEQPAQLGEVRRLFAEGRLTWNGGQARSGLDAVLAVSSLGADAGVSRFERFFLADRLGQSPLAVPVGKLDARPRPDVRLVEELGGWIDDLRRAASRPTAPQSIVQAASQVERAVFAVVDERPESFLVLLAAVADAEAEAGRTESARTESARANGALRPVPWLSSKRWLAAIDDGTPELRLAVSLASARDDAVKCSTRGLVRSLLRPVVAISGAHGRDGRDRFGGRVIWTTASAPVVGAGMRPAHHLLADALVLRAEAERTGASATGVQGDGSPACEPWFRDLVYAAPGDAEALVADRSGHMVDRLGRLLPGILLLRPAPSAIGDRWSKRMERAVVPAWRVLAPFFSSCPVPLPGGPLRLRPQRGWPRRLVANDVGGVLADALLRLRMARLTPRYREVGRLAHGVDGRTLATALLLGAPRNDVCRALRSVITDLDEADAKPLSGPDQGQERP